LIFDKATDENKLAPFLWLTVYNQLFPILRDGWTSTSFTNFGTPVQSLKRVKDTSYLVYSPWPKD